MSLGMSVRIRVPEQGFDHGWARCVRRARLCGVDPETRKDFSHRRVWIKDRRELRASCFGIEVVGHAVLDTHCQAILRTRPDLVALWSAEEVVRRWLKLTSKKLAVVEPKETKIHAALADVGTIR